MASLEWWEDERAFEAIRDFVVLHGILKKSSHDPGDLNVTNLSVTLTPFHFPEELFHHACSIQTSINSLIDAVSLDVQFLSSVLESVVSTDDFTRRLLEIYLKVAPDNKQTCAFSIQRSDYMIDHKIGTVPVLRQIEMNTIAASCFGLTQDKLEDLLRFVNTRFRSREDLNIPPNKCLDACTEGMAQVWREYGNTKACVLLVHEKGETNIYDSRPIEFLLWKKYRIPMIYRTLLEVCEQGRLGPNRELLMSEQEVAVVYFRTAYSPDHYPTEKEWEARLLCEMSRASNCPSVGHQLAGTKKVQQALAVPGTLEKYISNPEAAAKIRATFAGLYSLDQGEEGDRAIDMALSSPADFVVKPQREGGGNNYYDDNVRTLLENIRSSPEREAYILMDRIRPPLQQGYVLRSGEHCVQQLQLSCELGIMGIFIRNGSREVLNKEGGYILRSKPSTTNEAGVSSGFGALDLPTLVPLQQYKTQK